MEKLELDFYYGREAEQFTFYRLPKALITDERFKEMTNNAKLLYGLMLDRMSLSKKRGWLDEENKVFIKYSLNNIEEDLNISRKTSGSLLKELEAIRERGYAVMNEEMAAHLVGVAAPVFNKEGYPRYAVSVAGLCFRPVEAFVAEVCDDVVQTAREISEFLAQARTMEDK